MKCNNCQKEINDDYKMCPYCGEAIIPIGNEAITENTEQEENFQQTDVAIQQNDISNETTAEASQQTVKQKKSKKGLIIALIAILLISAGALGYFFLYLPYNQPLRQLSQKIEAANEIDPLTLVELKNTDKYTLTIKENQIKANVPGEYSVIYTLTNKKDNSAKDQTFKFTVADTTPPEIRILTDEPIKAVFGEKFSIRSLINIYDIVDGVIIWENINVEGTVDENKLGTYPLTISVSDKAGNKTTKTINIIEEARGDEYEFIKKITGVWLNDMTNNYCSFWLSNGVYIMNTGYFPSNNSGDGVLTFVEANSEKTIVKFNWDKSTYIYIDYGKLFYSAFEKKTIIIDTGISNDDKIFVDIGDGKGFQEYKYMGTQTI